VNVLPEANPATIAPPEGVRVGDERLMRLTPEAGEKTRAPPSKTGPTLRRNAISDARISPTICLHHCQGFFHHAQYASI
jgi:hypothetical protein